MTIDIFSVSDKKRIDILYVQLKSIKEAKEDNTVINYYLLIEDVDQDYINYFVDLQSNTFHVYFMNASDYKSNIHLPECSYLCYLRCLAPSIFPLKDKILYLDTDVFAMNTGIEDLWNTDISTKYIAAATDIEVQYNTPNQMLNVGKTDNYFNSGVLLMNLKRMRQNNIDQKLEKYLLKWPTDKISCLLHDQTLLNYVIGNEVKIVSSKWNNSIMSMAYKDQKAYQFYYETEDLNKQIRKAILVHMKGVKPWDAVSEWTCDQLPNRRLLQQVYGQLYQALAKHQEF